MTAPQVAPSLLVKVEGAGNDFLLGLGDWAAVLADRPDEVIRLCHRRFGIGADGVLALQPEGPDRVGLTYRNADGSQEPFCGNGTRCAALAAVELLGMPRRLVVATGWTDVPATVDGQRVCLGLPEARFESGETVLETPWGRVTGVLATLGVPHLLIESDHPESVALADLGPVLGRHPDLGPTGANVSILGPERSGTSAIRTWERGVEGETLCCGSAVAVAGVLRIGRNGASAARLRSSSGAELLVRLADTGLELEGPATLVAEIRPL